jgi:hypothetical protein
MVVAEKADGSPLVCVDLTKLNRYVKRPLHPTRTPRDAIACISGSARFFTTVDDVQGYHQIELHPDSQSLTNFVTPWGRYMFLRGIMGLSATGDKYCRRGDEAFGDLPNTVKVLDDVLQFDDDFASHVEGTRRLLQRCREANNTLGLDKFVFATMGLVGDRPNLWVRSRR